jgi:hypothetical protein
MQVHLRLIDLFVNGKMKSWVEEEAVIDKGDDDFHLSMDFLALEIKRSGQSLPNHPLDFHVHKGGICVCCI